MGKGKDFEREVSVLFSNWLTNGAHDDYVWHTGSSGARGTVRKKNAKSAENETIGDLAAAHDSMKFFFDTFSVELKTGYPKSKRKSKKDQVTRIHNWSLTDILDGKEKKPTFLGFWDQAIGDACKSHREPLMVFRRNMKQPCIVIAKDIFECIQYNLKPPKRVISKIILYPKFYMPVVVCGLKDFFRFTYNQMTDEFLRGVTSAVFQHRDAIEYGRRETNG